MNKILLIGKHGKLAKAFQRKIPNIIALDRDQANNSLLRQIDIHQPDVIINCAAYTDVDAAESNKAIAYEVNARFVANLAKICERNCLKLVHYSTDYVFGGKKESSFNEETQPSPINYYGYTKLAGEILSLEHNPEVLIIRFSFPFGLEFNNNFLNTILTEIKNGNVLELRKKGKGIEASTKQLFCPTWVDDLVDATLDLIWGKFTGLIHFCNQGKVITPYDYALTLARFLGSNLEIREAKSPDTRLAKRPNSVVLSTDLYQSLIRKPRNWEEALKKYLTTLDLNKI